MSRIITIPGFKGGLSRDKYEDLSLQSYQSARDLNVFGGKHVLKPYISLANDAGVTNTNKIRNMIEVNSASRRYLFLGDNGSGKTRIFSADSSALDNSTAQTTEGTSSNNILGDGSLWLTAFKGTAYFGTPQL